MLHFYRTLDFQGLHRRIERVAEAVLDGPSIRAVYGVGHPFYGDVVVTPLNGFSFLALMRGKRGGVPANKHSLQSGWT